jgi:D-sedoheptulose 7-phosphate isomerase
MMTTELIKTHIQKSIDAKQAIYQSEAFLKALADAGELCVEAYRQGKKVILAGNGGSAGDAQHIAAELVGRYKFDRPALPSIALTTDTSAITAIGNDYGYDQVFSRQLDGLSQEGDVFIGISTSGNSKNILAAVEVARKKGCKVIGFSGANGALKDLSDVAIAVPAAETATIQESHIMCGHIICDIIEQSLWKKES